MKRLKSLWVFMALLFPLLLPMGAQAVETKASYALLLDAETGVALFEKNADARMSPASMSKLMTVLMAFEALESGAVTDDEKFFVSDDAWRRGGAASGGSTMFLKARCIRTPRARIWLLKDVGADVVRPMRATA